MNQSLRKRIEAVESSSRHGEGSSVFDDPKVRTRADAAVREIHRRLREMKPEPTPLQYREFFELLPSNLFDLPQSERERAKLKTAEKAVGPFGMYSFVAWVEHRIQTDADELFHRMQALDNATEDELEAMREEAKRHEPPAVEYDREAYKRMCREAGEQISGGHQST